MSKKKEEKKNQSTVPAKLAGIATSPLIKKLATGHNIEPERYVRVIMKTAFKGTKDPTGEEFAAFMMVAEHYKLDPFLNQIYAFPSKGGIIPFLGVDGWIDLINRQPKHSGLEVVEEEDSDGKPLKTTVKIHVQGYDQPITISERFSECVRDTGTWKSHPFRMLRHKAIIQCGRVAYGLSGLYDEDEARRIAAARGDVIDAEFTEGASTGQALPLPMDPDKVNPPHETEVELEPEDTPEDTDTETGGDAQDEPESPAEESTETPEDGSQAGLDLDKDDNFALKDNIREIGEVLAYKKDEIVSALAEAGDDKAKLEALHKRWYKELNKKPGKAV